MSRRTQARSLLVVGIVLLASVFLAPTPDGQERQPPFPHDRHERVFPLCTSCHAGVVTPELPLWPDASTCASCHDGTIEQRVSWQPRTLPRPTNLRFAHDVHGRAAAAKNVGDSALIQQCGACHVPDGAKRMSVRRAVVEQCLSCHRLSAPHVDNPPESCATCHRRLSDAPTLTRGVIAAFPRPRSHDASDFVFGGHGRAARVPGSTPGPLAVAESCATCHSRDLCLTCHVNAPETAPIAALTLDERPPRYEKAPPVPPSHGAAGFLQVHGRAARRADATCATCHTRESCTTCHQGTQPPPVVALGSSGHGRAAGARLVRRPPATHDLAFREGHGALANARPGTCETCHQRSSCLACHRPDGTRQVSYHPPAFVTRHPSAAYSRIANCSDCHNPAQFCQSCHQTSGLVATSRIGRAGYHDAFRGFSLGHGQAARQNLESCASCHAERDCTACHSAVGGGFRFNPHGPGFDGERLRSKNPSLCIACHGRAIPRSR